MSKYVKVISRVIDQKALIGSKNFVQQLAKTISKNQIGEPHKAVQRQVTFVISVVKRTCDVLAPVVKNRKTFEAEIAEVEKVSLVCM